MESAGNSISGAWKKMMSLRLAIGGLGAASPKTAAALNSVVPIRQKLMKEIVNPIIQ